MNANETTLKINEKFQIIFKIYLPMHVGMPLATP